MKQEDHGRQWFNGNRSRRKWMGRRIFNEEHQIFRESFRKFLEKEVVSFIEKWEHEGIVPRDVWRKMGGNGFLCPWLEEKYGGSNAG